MTPEQRAAIEILLDAQNVLDTDTQIMPLMRFVLFGTTGTVESEQEQEQAEPSHGESPFYLCECGNGIYVRCIRCGESVERFSITDHPSLETMYGIASEKGECPHCHAKFK